MRPKRILVVDDEPYILKSMQYLLEDEYEVDVAVNGKEALAQLRLTNADYDLIICDLSMPDINGAELYLQVATQYPQLEKRIIFMTGGIFGGYIQDTLISSTHPCIAKPFESEELHKMIKKFFRELKAASE